jgi:hypothetical protein
MLSRIVRSLRRPGFIAAMAGSVVLATTVAPATAVGTCTPGDMPDVLATADIEQGQTGTGWTVVQGTTPVSFDVEVLSVEHDIILPGHALVLVKLSGPVIDQIGGIAAGMSGSPVYIDGKLAGALAYSIYGDQTLAGMTPAEEMVQIFSNPTAETTTSMPPQRFPLSASARRAIAREEGRPMSTAPMSASSLPTPLAVSGLSDQAMGKFRKMLKQMKLNVIAYRAQSVSTSQPLSPTPLQPGDSYSAVISTGDLTSGGIGTETARCGDLTLGWGHYFFLGGPTSYGLNGANVVTVVSDQSHQYSYKWADITEAHGTVDQDRFSAIRGIDGAYPDVVPITSDVVNEDLFTLRDGETDVLRQEFVPDYAAFHLLLNMYSVFDRVGDGTDTITWTVQGKRQDGSPWTLGRTNMFFSNYDSAYEGIFELLDDLYLIAFNDFEKVTFTSVDEQASMTQEHLTTRIKKVQWATHESPVFTAGRTILTHAGGLIRVRATLLDEGSTTPRIVNLKLRVPATARRGGSLVVRGGGNTFDDEFFFGDGGPSAGRAPKSFDDLLAQLDQADHNYDLETQLSAPGVPRTGGAGKVVRAQSVVVFGEKDFSVSFGGAGGGGGFCTAGKPCPG